MCQGSRACPTLAATLISDLIFASDAHVATDMRLPGKARPIHEPGWRANADYRYRGRVIWWLTSHRRRLHGHHSRMLQS